MSTEDIPTESYAINIVANPPPGVYSEPQTVQFTSDPDGFPIVCSVSDTAAILGGKQPVINIHNYAGASVSTSQGQDGSIQVIIDAVEKKLSAGIIAGGSALDTTFRRTYGVKR